MESYSWKELNEAAMQIILNAGDARKLIVEAIDLICADAKPKAINDVLAQAKELIIKAHIIQTKHIQNGIEDENQKNCLLFSHAQDTLMTVQSEHLMVKNMIKLYNHLKETK